MVFNDVVLLLEQFEEVRRLMSTQLLEEEIASSETPLAIGRKFTGMSAVANVSAPGISGAYAS